MECLDGDDCILEGGASQPNTFNQPGNHFSLPIEFHSIEVSGQGIGVVRYEII